MNNRAQSESIGVILLTGIVVISITTVGAFALSDIDSDQRDFDATIEVTTDSITVAHGGGDPVPFSELLIVVRIDGTTTRIQPDASELVSGDSDDTFEPGERWVDESVSYSMDDLVTVRLFDASTQLSEDRLYPNTAVTTGTVGPTPTDSATPTETATPTPTETTTPTATPTPTDSTAPGVTVNAPDGGEMFADGDTTTIEWAASDTESGVSSLDVAYSSDGGSTWTTIVSGATNDGSYDWTIPEVNTTDVLVQVTATDNAGNSASDRSDSTFTVDSAPPSIEDYSNVTGDKNSNNITVGTFNANDNNELERVVFKVYDSKGNQIGSKTVTLSEKTANLSSVEVTTDGLEPNKEYTVEVTLYDIAGNTVVQNETVTVSGGGGSPGNGNGDSNDPSENPPQGPQA